MYLNNIDFPNQILDAVQDNKLVVFAGAGASVDKSWLSLPEPEHLSINRPLCLISQILRKRLLKIQERPLRKNLVRCF